MTFSLCRRPLGIPAIALPWTFAVSPAMAQAGAKTLLNVSDHHLDYGGLYDQIFSRAKKT